MNLKSLIFNLESGSGGEKVTVTKADLIKKVEELGISEKIAKVAVEIVIDSISAALKKGEKAQISGFGCFRIKERRNRIARNPKTGAAVNVAAKKVSYFVPSESLKNFVR